MVTINTIIIRNKNTNVDDTHRLHLTQHNPNHTFGKLGYRGAFCPENTNGALTWVVSAACTGVCVPGSASRDGPPSGAALGCVPGPMGTGVISCSGTASGAGVGWCRRCKYQRRASRMIAATKAAPMRTSVVQATCPSWAVIGFSRLSRSRCGRCPEYRAKVSR